MRTQVSAVIDKAAVKRCAAFVERAEQEGAKILCGGQPASVFGKRFFFNGSIETMDLGRSMARRLLSDHRPEFVLRLDMVVCIVGDGVCVAKVDEGYEYCVKDRGHEE